MGGILSLFKNQPQTSNSKSSAPGDLLPTLGSVVPCRFVRNGEIIHSMCLVEERNGTSLMFRVMREMGKVTLSGLRVGEGGQIETTDRLIPLRVIRVQLPWIAVVTSPERSHPVQRQFLRVPASFSVRMRRRGSGVTWKIGRGVDISSGGFCVALPISDAPRLQDEYVVELTLNFTRSEREVFEMEAQVRRVAAAKGEVSVGMHVGDPAQRKELAAAVSRLQQLMIRQPEDYLLVEGGRPRLGF